jgi:hypothetical protein
LTAVVAVALTLIHYRPGSVSSAELQGFEGFASGTGSRGSESNEDAMELNLILEKLSNLEFDLNRLAIGKTLKMQFRTSHDMEAVSSLVDRCIQNAIEQRDIDLVAYKFRTRAYELIGDDEAARRVFDQRLNKVVALMETRCQKHASLVYLDDWMSPVVNDLSQYEGISSTPR